MVTFGDWLVCISQDILEPGCLFRGRTPKMAAVYLVVSHFKSHKMGSRLKRRATPPAPEAFPPSPDAVGAHRQLGLRHQAHGLQARQLGGRLQCPALRAVPARRDASGPSLSPAAGRSQTHPGVVGRTTGTRRERSRRFC